QRVDAILGRLHPDGVVHAILEVEPVVGRDLGNAREGHEQARGDVLLREPELLRAPPVDVDVDGRYVHDLLQADVDGAGDGAAATYQILRDPQVRRIAADDLHVDGRRQAEVQDLPHDVGRLEEEHEIGKPLAQG